MINCRLARSVIGWLTGKIGVRESCTRDGVTGLTRASGTGLQHNVPQSGVDTEVVEPT